MPDTINREFNRQRSEYTAAEITNRFIEADVRTWNERWRLNGSVIICAGCGGSQPVSESGVTFESKHAHGCRYAALVDQMPLNRLAGVLSRWKLEEWDEEKDEYIRKYSELTVGCEVDQGSIIAPPSRSSHQPAMPNSRAPSLSQRAESPFIAISENEEISTIAALKA